MPRFAAWLLSSSALAGCLFSVTVLANECPALGKADLVCVASPQGYFYASSQAGAQQMADAAREAAAIFEHDFSRPAPMGAIAEMGNDSKLSLTQERTLKDAGARWVFSWISPSDKRKATEASVRAQVEKQLGAGADAALIDAAVAKAMLKISGGAKSDTTTYSVLRHEIGHKLLIYAFPTSADTGDGGEHGYGGGLPDWMDETAAILMEDEAMTTGRRDHLRQLLACGTTGQLWPLPEFLTMEHPMAQVTRKMKGGQFRMLVLTGDEAKEYGKAANFYTQTRAFADFLTDMAGGDTTIWGGIAATLSTGKGMDAWLADEGARHGLPGSLAGLGSAWQAWLRKIAATAPACTTAAP